MKFSIGLPGLTRYPPSRFPAGTDNWQAHLGCADYQRVARIADDLGFDAITVPEHVALPADLEANMGAYWPHAFTVMAFVAGATSRIRVNASVIVLPYHHPVPLAKAISTLDVLSGGRVMLNFGVGMAPAEFAACGIPFERRGRVTDEYIAAMKALWTQDRPAYAGEFVQIADVVFEPKPLQHPYPPVWFGGRSMASLRRAARAGDGWAPHGGFLGKGPWFDDVEELPGLLTSVAATRAELGNDRPFDVYVPIVQGRIGPHHTVLPPTFVPETAQQIVDEVGRVAGLGVTWTTVPCAADVDDSLDGFLDGLRWIAAEVLPAFR